MSEGYIATISKKKNTVVRKHAQDLYFYIIKIFKYQTASLLLCVQQILSSRNFNGLGQIDKNTCTFQIKGQGLMTAKCPYIEHTNINLRDDQFFQTNTAAILESIICKLFKADVFSLYSYENILINPHTFGIQINKLSVAGLLPILLKTSFTKEEFVEVYQLLDQSLFQSKQIQNRKKLVSYKTKFRAIGMMILHFIFKKRVNLLSEMELSQKSETVPFEQAHIFVQKQKQKFKFFLSKKQVKQQILRAEERDSLNYLYFLQKVFIDDFRKIEWRQVFNLLITKYKQPERNQQKQKELRQFQQKINKLLVNQLQKQSSDIFNKNYLKQLGILDGETYLILLLNTPNLGYHSITQQILQQKSLNQYNFNLFHHIIKIVIQNLEEYPLQSAPSPSRNDPKEKTGNQNNKKQNNSNYQTRIEQEQEYEFKYTIIKGQKGENEEVKNREFQDQSKSKNQQQTTTFDIIYKMYNSFKANKVDYNGVEIYSFAPIFAVLNKYLILVS